MDKGDLVGGHPLGDELLANVLIDGKGRLRLIQWDCFFQPMKQRIVQLFGCLFGGSCLAAIRGDFEHIIHRRVHTSSVYFGSALGECFHHFLLMFSRLCHNIVVFHLRGGQVQLVGGLDVRHLFEQVHQLRQIKELAESRPCPVACSLRGQFQRRDGFSEAAGPAVEVGHVQLLQAVILEIPLHGVKFGHAVRYGGAGGENHTTVSGQFIHIATLCKHIAGLLGIAGGETCHIPHFGV